MKPALSAGVMSNPDGWAALNVDRPRPDDRERWTTLQAHLQDLLQEVRSLRTAIQEGTPRLPAPLPATRPHKTRR
jgi:hypothetical protein